MPNSMPHLREKVCPDWQRPGLAVNKAQEGRKTMSRWPAWSHSTQHSLGALAYSLQYQWNQGYWRESVQYSSRPLMRQCIQPQRAARIAQGEPHLAVGRLPRCKEIHLGYAKSVPTNLRPPLHATSTPLEGVLTWRGDPLLWAVLRQRRDLVPPW